MPYDDADTRWSWRKFLPPAPSFSFFGDPLQQAAVGVQDTPLQVGSFGGVGKPQIALSLANSTSPMPATSTGATGPVTPLVPLDTPTEPPKGPGYNPAITAPGAKPSDTVMPSGVPLAGFHGGQTPEKTFNQKLLDLIKDGNFSGALTDLGKSVGGGTKAASGTAPSPHPFQVSQIQQMTKPRDTTGKAEALLKAANGVWDLRAKRGAAEQDRYSILNKKQGLAEALKGLI